MPENLNGWCPICEKKVVFFAASDWYRDDLICPSCKSVPRERGLAYVLDQKISDWSEKKIHECAPASRGISQKLRRMCSGYLPSNYFPNCMDDEVDGLRNVNLENQNFPSNHFDLFIALDVLEHLFDPEAALREVERTLRPGGLAIMTFPIKNDQVEAVVTRALKSDRGVDFLVDPEYHGNPIDEDGGSLVTMDYGYQIHQQIFMWTGMQTEILRLCRPDIGVIGEFTEVVVCTKI